MSHACQAAAQAGLWRRGRGAGPGGAAVQVSFGSHWFEVLQGWDQLFLPLDLRSQPCETLLPMHSVQPRGGNGCAMRCCRRLQPPSNPPHVPAAVEGLRDFPAPAGTLPTPAGPGGGRPPAVTAPHPTPHGGRPQSLPQGGLVSALPPQLSHRLKDTIYAYLRFPGCHTPLAVSTPRAMIVCNCLHPNGRDPCSTNSFIILHLIPSKVWCQPDLIFLQIVSFSSLDVFRFLSVSDVLRFYYV